MNPESKADFDLLYNALKKWRIEEVERINVTLSGAERKAALCALLEQETQFISSIELHRMAAGTRNQDKAIQAFLNKEHKCKLTQDIVELIDMEVDLLMRGVKKSNLEGLRKRIATLFLQYIKTPEFNSHSGVQISAGASGSHRPEKEHLFVSWL